MATVIAPATGNGALFTQGGAGASPGYSAIDVRRAGTGGLQEGVYASGSFAVTQRASGVNLSVDIAATTHENGIAAIVAGESITGQGLYVCPPNASIINEAITTANATNPRVDRVVLEIQDNTHDASGQNRFQVRVITGTATSGATLDNLTGAASVPNNCLLLADVLVPANDTTISDNQIRDRRKWARGASVTLTRSADYTRTLGTFALIDSANLQRRVECSGVPLRVTLTADSLTCASATKIGIFDLFIDGATAGRIMHLSTPSVGAFPGLVSLEFNVVPSAGSHLIGPAWASDGSNTIQLNGSQANAPIVLTIEERVRQNAANTATSG